MGKSTIVYKASGSQDYLKYNVLGYKDGSDSGTIVTSGAVGSAPQTIVVSGFDSYQFQLLVSGLSITGTDFSDGGKQAVTVVFGATG